MIPIALAAGFGVGLWRPQWKWVVVVGALWALLLSFAGDPELSMIVIWTVGLAYGVVNAALGFWLGRGIHRWQERRTDQEAST